MAERASAADVATWALDALAASCEAPARDAAAPAARAVVANLDRDELVRVVGCLAELWAWLFPGELARGRTAGEVIERYRFVVVMNGVRDDPS